MTAHIVDSFRGEVPLLTPRKLPENAAQAAVNSRLYTGDLTAFKQFGLTHVLANSGTVRTIALMQSFWLSWEQQVDVARGIIPGDTTYRTYITGLDVPRFTNLDMATGVPNGSAPEPYPFETRVLGVSAPDSVPTLAVGVDPTPTTFSVDIVDECDDLSTNWILSPGQTTSSNYSTQVTQDAAFGNPLPSFKVVSENNTSTPAYAYRDFGTATATAIHASWDVNVVDNGPNDGAQVFSLFACDTGGGGARIFVGKKFGNPINIGIALGSDFAAGNGSTLVDQGGGSANWTEDIWYTVEATLTKNPDGTSTITAAVYLGSVKLNEVTTTNVFAVGGLFGPMSAKGDDRLEVNYDNYAIQASGSTGTVIQSVATSYVYTFANDLGEESAPSLPSSTILRPDGVSVTVTTPTTLPSGVSADEFITTKRIYRSVTGSTGTVFRFVAEIPLAQADYVDVLADSDLGEDLQSELWAKPPSDLEGILALPNGVMVGFRRNQLCLSAQNQPHAWPVEYRKTTDTDIVGIANVDTTVIIGTQNFLYVASGNDPAAYSMSKSEVPYAASSKLSFDYITGLGVVFSGPDGLMATQGIGQVKNLTQSVFTRRQWQALNPESIVSVAHNDIYFMFWETEDDRGCYAVDLRPDGFGIVQMAFHASASYVDPIEDKMYLVLDANTEPDDEIIPVRSQFLLTYASGGDGTPSAVTPPDFGDVQALVRGAGNLTDYSDNAGTIGYFIQEVDAAPIFSTTTPLLFGQPMIRVGGMLSGPVTSGIQIDAAQLALGTGDFKIEVWLDATLATNHVLFVFSPSGAVPSSGIFIAYDVPGASFYVTAGNVGLGQFYGPNLVYGLNFVMLVRENGRFFMYVNGAPRQAYGPPPNYTLIHGIEAAFDLDPYDLLMGGLRTNTTTTSHFSYIGEVRVTRGAWDGSYAVPTEPFPSPGYVPPAPPIGTPGVNGITIFEFEGDPTQTMIYRWRTKLWLEVYEMFHTIAQVRAEGYTNLVVRIFGDGVMLDEIVLTEGVEFTLTPPEEAYNTFEMELLGTDTVRVLEAADDVTELT